MRVIIKGIVRVIRRPLRPASKWELITLPDLSSYKRTTDHCESEGESDDKGIRRTPDASVKVEGRQK